MWGCIHSQERPKIFKLLTSDWSWSCVQVESHGWDRVVSCLPGWHDSTHTEPLRKPDLLVRGIFLKDLSNLSWTSDLTEQSLHWPPSNKNTLFRVSLVMTINKQTDKQTDPRCDQMWFPEYSVNFHEFIMYQTVICILITVQRLKKKWSCMETEFLYIIKICLIQIDCFKTWCYL